MEQHISDKNHSHDDKHITVQAFRTGTRNVISTLLNPIKIIPTDNRLSRDWRGLADLFGIGGEKIPNLQRDHDPTSKVLNMWYEKDKNLCTIDTFLKYLEELDRFDVIDDISPLIEEDIKYFKQNPNGFSNNLVDIKSDTDILTVDDVNRRAQGLGLQIYDAFVLFADDDIDFVTELIETMEKTYNLKLCLKDRDLVGGVYEHDSIIKLIAERCCRLIVILSPEFFESSANKFFYNFAQAVGLEQKRRKVIPCLYKNCGKLPVELLGCFVLDYERTNKLCNFWEKLRDSIKISNDETPSAVANGNLVRSSSEYNTSSIRSLTSSEREPEKSSTDSLWCRNNVKFKSMTDLDQKIVPDEGISESNSANSLAPCPEMARNNTSLYKRFRKIIKPKSTKNEEQKSETPNLVTNVEIKKTKKKNFFSKSKRKVALAN